MALFSSSVRVLSCTSKSRDGNRLVSNNAVLWYTFCFSIPRLFPGLLPLFIHSSANFISPIIPVTASYSISFSYLSSFSLYSSSFFFPTEYSSIILSTQVFFICSPPLPACDIMQIDEHFGQGGEPCFFIYLHTL